MLKRRRYDEAESCPVAATLDLIDGKWKGMILYQLLRGPRRFSELHRELTGITQRMLTRQLRELEAAELLTRTVHPQVPPRVDYALTDAGASLHGVIRELAAWGRGRILRIRDGTDPSVRPAAAVAGEAAPGSGPSPAQAEP